MLQLQVWKDVDGVLTCDPNIYPKAQPVPHLTFEEAAELAYFGAQVCFYLQGWQCHWYLRKTQFPSLSTISYSHVQ